ncbi:MAG: DEAD/DEAH box helicase [Endozoicomonas sp.]
MLFSDLALHERLQKALNELGFDKATPVQEKTIPEALESKDLLVNAETGSGKTAAFLLPMLHHMQNNPAPKSSTRGLILVPTRELARQVLQECESLAKFTYLKAGLITGGDDFRHQVNTLRKNPEILIATPGRLLEQMESSNTDFSDLEYLILDEADRMLDFGFSADMVKIASECRQERQTMLFSATLKQKGMHELIQLVLKDPESITLSTARDKHENIHQQIMLADDVKHKEKLLEWLLKNESFEKALVFSNTRDNADRLCAFLRYHDLKVGVLHGEMDHKDRKKTMTMLQEGHINILVATDVAARGLDVKGIELVVNFDMARSGDDYVHRIGRTGRAGEKGLAISLIMSTEWNLMSSIERYLKTRFEKRSIKELRGTWKGPKKLKASGKAAGTKKKKTAAKGKEDTAKQRHRDRKNVGKRRAPKQQQASENAVDAGFEPLKRKKS